MSTQHSTLTGADLHEPKGIAEAPGGQVYVSDGSGSGNWQSPLVNVKNLNSFEANGVIDNISSSGSEYQIRFGRNCTVTDIFGVISGAITGSNSVITLYRDGVALGQTITVPTAGSGAGVKITSNLSPTYNFTEGQVLRLAVTTASTNAVKLYFTVKATAT